MQQLARPRTPSTALTSHGEVFARVDHHRRLAARRRPCVISARLEQPAVQAALDAQGKR
jgi:hypothetical protein